MNNFGDYQMSNADLLQLLLANQTLTSQLWNPTNLLLGQNLIGGFPTLNQPLLQPLQYFPNPAIPVAPPIAPEAPAPIPEDPEDVRTVKIESEPKEEPKDAPFEMGSLPTSTYYPTHFMRGTQVQIANGQTKKVEDLSSDDFLKCAAESNDVMVNASIVKEVRINSAASVTVVFETGIGRHQIPLKCQIEHPFFVLGKGWSSCNPQKSGENYGLDCAKLEVNDVCVVLTRKNAECAVDIVTAEREMEQFGQKAAMREEIAEIYYEHVDGRISAPPERILTHPPTIYRFRKISE